MIKESGDESRNNFQLLFFSGGSKYQKSASSSRLECAIGSKGLQEFIDYTSGVTAKFDDADLCIAAQTKFLNSTEQTEFLFGLTALRRSMFSCEIPSNLFLFISQIRSQSIILPFELFPKKIH